MAGLVHLDPLSIFRCGVEVAEATAALDPTEWAAVPTDIEGPGSPHFERWLEQDRRTERLAEEAERLKRALGATGRLRTTDRTADGDPRWESYDRRFADTAHDRGVRLALVKLATAAIDLSGFATWREPQSLSNKRGSLPYRA